ncbi:hypothetical protein NQ318_002670 [Aromia moschata]|uniref:Integrase zinc-binding domain-containing protein n=1 Tax=Aromia moschata TaxID=1265417 RepID=A0AAV8XUB0_9CUCU|nr:hypothetical protein NQ318_002670 [Aromia moschata]
MSDQYLSVASMMNESAIERNKNRFICMDVMNRLKKEFYLYSVNPGLGKEWSSTNLAGSFQIWYGYKGYWAQWNSLCLRDGLLHRKWESPDGVSVVYQLVLPKARIHQVLEELHSSPTGGHFGVTRTLARVRDRFYWVNCRRDVEEWCKISGLCSAKKGPKTRSRGKMVQYLSGAPFERVAVDILGPLPDWDKLAPLFLLSYRSSQHESTTYTPSVLTSRREMKLPEETELEETEERSLPEFVEDLRERMDRVHEFARGEAENAERQNEAASRHYINRYCI